jgi:hypothetical protein
VLPGLAHRTVRCATGLCPVHHRIVSGAPGKNDFKLVTFGKIRGRSAIIHRTVRCASGATVICAQRSTLQSKQCKSDVRAAVRGAPDCPVSHRTVRCHMRTKTSNGRPAPSPNGRMPWRHTGHCPVAHRTVRCAHRQQTSLTATILLVAINTTPTGHFKVWEPKQHSKSFS